MANFVEDIAVQGEYVEQLKDKRFFIAKAPKYENLPDLDNPEKKKRKLKMTVYLSDGSLLDYYPNKTSLKTMASLAGYDMDNWIGLTFTWKTASQAVRGQTKTVLFVDSLAKDGLKFDVKETENDEVETVRPGE